MSLLNKKCVPCEKNTTKPLSRDEATDLLRELTSWELSHDVKMISRRFHFKDFVASMHFVERVADIAEGEGHHPDLHISYDNVLVELTTHAIHGLSENDFIVAAKIDALGA